MREKQLGDYIAANFSTIFPDYIFVKREFKLPNGSKIDFYAVEKETNRDVIIELKIGKCNPNNQLLSYGYYFFNPILIGIVGDQFKNFQEEIQYINHTEIFQRINQKNAM